MAIIRAERPEANYTVVSNVVFERNQLSFQAIGMLCYLLSKPDNWQVSPTELARVTNGTAKKTGVNGVYTILKELITGRFIVRKKHGTGKIDYFVYDCPVNEDESSNPNDGNPDEANPYMDTPDDGKPNEANHHEDTPNDGNPDEANPDEAFRKQVSNKDLVSNKLKDLIPPKNFPEPAPKSKSKKIPVPDLDFSVFGEITPEQIQMILCIRKSKRANVTQNVLNQLAKQFGIAARSNGLSLQECLDEWEYRGWQAFKAEWLSKPGNGMGLSLSELNDDTSWIDGMDLDELGFNGV